MRKSKLNQKASAKFEIFITNINDDTKYLSFLNYQERNITSQCDKDDDFRF